MSDAILPAETAASAMAHMNEDHGHNLLDYARRLAGADWAASAVMTAVDAQGFEIVVSDGNGREETHRIPFAEPVTNGQELRKALVELAFQADVPDQIKRVATARVATPKASRYLKTLCNHFNRKVEAAYEDDKGHVDFPFGTCDMHVEDETLVLTVTAESASMFDRVKHVVADHLIRFGNREELQVNWVDEQA